jgi:hypothetical protein
MGAGQQAQRLGLIQRHLQSTEERDRMLAVHRSLRVIATDKCQLTHRQDDSALHESLADADGEFKRTLKGLSRLVKVSLPRFRDTHSLERVGLADRVAHASRYRQYLSELSDRVDWITHEQARFPSPVNDLRLNPVAARGLAERQTFGQQVHRGAELILFQLDLSHSLEDVGHTYKVVRLTEHGQCLLIADHGLIAPSPEPVQVRDVANRESSTVTIVALLEQTHRICQLLESQIKSLLHDMQRTSGVEYRGFAMDVMFLPGCLQCYLVSLTPLVQVNP